MAVYPAMVNTKATITWNGVSTVLERGTVMLLNPGSALETTITAATPVTNLAIKPGAHNSAGSKGSSN
jgi:hypothetical protein